MGSCFSSDEATFSHDDTFSVGDEIGYGLSEHEQRKRDIDMRSGRYRGRETDKLSESYYKLDVSDYGSRRSESPPRVSSQRRTLYKEGLRQDNNRGNNRDNNLYSEQNTVQSRTEHNNENKKTTFETSSFSSGDHDADFEHALRLSKEDAFIEDEFKLAMELAKKASLMSMNTTVGNTTVGNTTVGNTAVGNTTVVKQNERKPLPSLRKYVEAARVIGGNPREVVDLINEIEGIGINVHMFELFPDANVCVKGPEYPFKNQVKSKKGVVDVFIGAIGWHFVTLIPINAQIVALKPVSRSSAGIYAGVVTDGMSHTFAVYDGGMYPWSHFYSNDANLAHNAMSRGCYAWSCKNGISKGSMQTIQNCCALTSVLCSLIQQGNLA